MSVLQEQYEATLRENERLHAALTDKAHLLERYAALLQQNKALQDEGAETRGFEACREAAVQWLRDVDDDLLADALYAHLTRKP